MDVIWGVGVIWDHIWGTFQPHSQVLLGSSTTLAKSKCTGKKAKNLSPVVFSDCQKPFNIWWNAYKIKHVRTYRHFIYCVYIVLKIFFFSIVQATARLMTIIFAQNIQLYAVNSIDGRNITNCAFFLCNQVHSLCVTNLYLQTLSHLSLSDSARYLFNTQFHSNLTNPGIVHQAEVGKTSIYCVFSTYIKLHLCASAIALPLGIHQLKVCKCVSSLWPCENQTFHKLFC